MTEVDEPFLIGLYGSTRPDLQALQSALGWTDEQLGRLVGQQHRAQVADYRARYPEAELLVVVREGVPVGRLYRVALPEARHLLDLAVAPEARGQGIGTELIRREIAAAAGRTVRIWLGPGDPTEHLVSRFGFAPTDEHDGHRLWVRPPDTMVHP